MRNTHLESGDTVILKAYEYRDFVVYIYLYVCMLR